MTKTKDELDELIAVLNRSLNVGTPKDMPKLDLIRRASDVTSPFKLRRPTGIVGLDLALRGGWPAGGLCQIAGPESVGKNALCWQTLAMLQKTYGEDTRIGWCWTEYPVDKGYGQQFGVIVPMSDEDIELENLARERDGRKPMDKRERKLAKQSLGEFVVVDRGSTEKRLQAVVEMVRSNLFQIIIVDSLGALLTEVQEDTDLDDEPQQSSEARLVTRFQNKLHGANSAPARGDVNWTTVIAINQVRANRSMAKFKKEWKVAGAHALRHGKLVDVWLTKAERIPADKKKPAEGRVVKWEIAKGKAGCHDGPLGSVEYYYDTGYGLADNLIATAKQLGMLTQHGKYWSLSDGNGEIIQDKLPGTKDLVRKAIVEPEWADALYHMVLKAEGVSCLFKR